MDLEQWFSFLVEHLNLLGELSKIYGSLDPMPRDSDFMVLGWDPGLDLFFIF